MPDTHRVETALVIACDDIKVVKPQPKLRRPVRSLKRDNSKTESLVERHIGVEANMLDILFCHHRQYGFHPCLRNLPVKGNMACHRLSGTPSMDCQVMGNTSDRINYAVP